MSLSRVGIIEQRPHGPGNAGPVCQKAVRNDKTPGNVGKASEVSLKLPPPTKRKPAPDDLVSGKLADDGA